MSMQPQKRIRLQCLVLGAEGAGKTAILRRYFHKTFDNTRQPTIGSDFYSGRIRMSFNFDQGTVVNLQMWDTPGRVRFSIKRQARKKYEAILSPDFFRQADAIMLVYDMTSSTSFTQLLKWYADLMEYQKGTKGNGDNSESPPRRPVPIFVVANKLDLLKTNSETEGSTNPRYRRVPQRDVMGLKGDFRGKDFRYEYQISPPVSNDSISLKKKKRSTPVDSKKRMEISSFLANRENWTTDWSYLDSLLNSEDLSHPDREMVLLWCARNGLRHFETSAASGEGVEEAVTELVELALVSKREQEERHQVRQQRDLTPHGKLDLHKRYAAKEHECTFFTPLLETFRNLTQH